MLLTTLFVNAQNGTLDPKNPPEPAVKYKLTVKAQPVEAAKTSGSGEYTEGTQVNVRATANTNYKFQYWLQNGERLSETRVSFKLTMPADFVELVAVFEYDEPVFNPTDPLEPQVIGLEYPLYLVADPMGAGTFNRISGTKVKEGTTISIKATPSTGYLFVGWYDITDTELGTNQILSYTMPNQPATLTARFTYNPSSPNEPLGSQDDVDNTILPGDVNGDGQVGIGDIVAVTNVMAGIGGNITKERADVNDDGQVGIGDIVAITNIMAGKSTQ